MKANLQSTGRLPERLALLVPTLLAEAIRAGAEARFISVSAYIRQAVIERLAADGIAMRKGMTGVAGPETRETT